MEYGPDQQRTSPIEVIGNLDYHPQTFSADQAVVAAKANRALLKQQRQNILIEVEAVRVAAAGYQPTLQAQGGLELRNSSLSTALDDTVQGWFFGGTFNWNIFDGLATYGRVKQSKATLVEAKVTYDDAVRQVVQEVESNYLTLQQSKELIASQTLNVSEAEEAVRLAQARLSGRGGNAARRVAIAGRTHAGADHGVAGPVRLRRGAGEISRRVTATSTIYDETFDDPLTARARRGGANPHGSGAEGR